MGHSFSKCCGDQSGDHLVPKNKDNTTEGKIRDFARKGSYNKYNEQNASKSDSTQRKTNDTITNVHLEEQSMTAIMIKGAYSSMKDNGIYINNVSLESNSSKILSDNPNYKQEIELEDEKKLERLNNDDSREKIVVGAATLGENQPNQDAFFIDQDHQCYGVFDGVGGAKHGDIASATARDYIQAKLANLPDNDIEVVKAEMKKILLEAHKAVNEKDQNSRMATTATIVKILKDRTVVIGNAGDSRAYRLSKEDQILEQLTLDNASDSDKGKDHPGWNHQEQVANLDTFEGDLDPMIRIEINFRHEVDNALGGKYKETDPAIYTYQLQAGDRLALTTDGIHDNLTDQQIANCMRKNDFNGQKVVGNILELATQIMKQYDPEKRYTRRSKLDDRTVIVVEIE